MAEMPRKTVRVPDRIWNAAQKKARARGVSVSMVVREHLERWVKSRGRDLSA